MGGNNIENGVDLFDTITMAISFYEGMYNIQLAIQKSTTNSYWKYRCMKDAISSFIQKLDNDSFVGNEEMSFHTFRYEVAAIAKVEGNGRDEEKDSSNNPLFSHHQHTNLHVSWQTYRSPQKPMKEKN